MVIARAAPLLVCTGCHLLFQLDEVKPTLGDGNDGDGGPPTCTIPYISEGDFDGDGTPNREDPCPAVAGASGDSDNDGIGDSCDPRVNIGGDCLLVFQDFRESTLPCWTTNNWTYDTSGWVSPSPPARDNLACTSLASITYGTMIGQIVEPTTDPLHSVVVMFNYKDILETAYVCGVRDLSNDFALASGTWGNDYLQTGIVAPVYPVLPFGPASVRLDRIFNGANSQCRLVVAAGSPATAEAAATPDVQGQLVIRSIATRFRVEAFIGYGLCSD